MINSPRTRESRRSTERNPRPGRRYTLRLQKRLNEQVFWPCILILAVGGGLLVWDPDKLEPVRTDLAVAVAGAGLVLVLTLVLRLRASVQCRAEGLRIRLPFVWLLIPYDQVKTTRPTELFRMFPPDRLRWTQRRFLRPLLGETVVVVELDVLPRPRPWLRLWMSEFMLCPDAVGFVLAVDDWLAFRIEFDEFKARRPRF